MTPLNYDFLQQKGFKLLIPIVSQNETPHDEALTIWVKEWDGKVIRLEYHKTTTAPEAKENDGMEANQDAPFYPEGLKLYTGEKGALEWQYEGTILYAEELAPHLHPATL